MPFAGLGSYFDDPWGDWNSTSTSTATTATNSDVWPYWYNQTTTSITNTYRIWVHGGQQTLVQTDRRTPEEEEVEARRREEEYRERQKVAAEKYRKAKECSEELLYEHLTDEQRAAIKRDKFFVVVGGKTGRKYKINAEGGLVANVHEMDDAGAVKRRLCAHITSAANAPIFDHILAQKLMLEHREEEFLRVANSHGR